MKTKFLVGGMILLAFLMVKCTSNTDNPPIDVSKMTIETVVVPSNFNYATSRDIEISLTAPEIFQGASFHLIALKSGKEDHVFGSGAFNTDGTFAGNYTINSMIDSIRVLSDYLGLTSQVDIAIVGKAATFDYRPLYVETKSANIAENNWLKSATVAPFLYMASYNASGVPSNLVPSDAINKDIYDVVNASLPERVPLTQTHPEYLSGRETNLVLTKQAEVWVTFVTEGAGWRNALGYYTDPEKELNIVFPNVSMSGSGGALTPGNKVKLGKFPANTTIGWFLVADGWNGTKVVAGNGIHYSNSSLNIEKDTNLKQHMVLLNDDSKKIVLMGFEDVPRDWAMCDNDFNDAVFYVTVNPSNAISTSNMSDVGTKKDADGDGIANELDAYPLDADKAFNNYAPSATSTASISFEDLWPSKGDYDFNDLVVDYQYNQITNSKNMVTSIEGLFTIANIGGSYKNGFAVELPISPSKIKSVNGQVLNSGYANINANGTEAGQDKAVIFVVENATEKKGTSIPIEIIFTTPVSTTELGAPPFNPFLVVNGDRSKEIHLPDMPPTNLGKTSIGQKDDSSVASQGRYYKTNQNLPWALNIFSNFSPPAEKISIDKVYPKFIPWSNSGGVKDQDWYKK